MQAALVRGSNNRPASRGTSRRSSAGINPDEAPILNGQDLTLELDRLRKEKVASIYEIERYKKRISLAIVFAMVGFAVAIAMVIWRFSPIGKSNFHFKILSPDGNHIWGHSYTMLTKFSDF